MRIGTVAALAIDECMALAYIHDLDFFFANRARELSKAAFRPADQE
jgi:hypothetical protein